MSWLKLFVDFPRSGGRARNLDSLDENQKAVVEALKRAGQPLDIDKIRELAKIDVSAVNRAISLLQIQDIIKEERGQYYLNL